VKNIRNENFNGKKNEKKAKEKKKQIKKERRKSFGPHIKLSE